MPKSRLDSLAAKLDFDRPVDRQRLEELQKKYRDRPVEFLTEILDVKQLTAEQIEIADAILQRPRVGVVSSNAWGKSFLIARLALWFLYTRKDARVILLGPGHRQLRLILWADIRDAFSLADLPGKMYRSLEDGLVLSETSSLVGFSTGPATGIKEGKITGVHGQHLLVVLEEAHSIEEHIWRGVSRLAVDEQCGRVVAIGNSSEPIGPWFDVHRNSPQNNWTTFALTAFDHPNLEQDKVVIPGAVTRQWVEQVAADFGVGSNFYKSAVLAEFVYSAPDALLKPEWLEYAAWLWDRIDIERLSPKIYVPRGPRRQVPSDIDLVKLGREASKIEGEAMSFGITSALDVAAESGLNALSVCRGPCLLGEIETWHAPEIDKNVAELKSRLHRGYGLTGPHWVASTRDNRGGIYWGPGDMHQDHLLTIDSVGLGYAMSEAMRLERWKVRPYKGSHAARIDPEKFANCRSESLFLLRLGLQNHRIAMPYSTELAEEGSLRWSTDLAGKIMMEQKKNLVSRIGRSPDRLDSVAMVFWMAIVRKGKFADASIVRW